MAPGIGQERQIQKSYWIEKTAGLKLEAMMHVHDLESSDLDKEDRHEVLSLLPSYEGKSVLELGAGIGRFTGDLAKKAGELVAVDFIEGVIKENESISGHHKNVKFKCADVTSPDLTFSPESVDLIFSNWLLMYLSDEEVQDLAERMMTWLKVGGYIFFRETCFHQSGDNKGKNNPTRYREPRFYTKVFQECNAGKSYELSLISDKCIETYIRNKRNQNEICWIWQKVRSEDDKGFPHFLDTVQYKSNGITGGIGQEREIQKTYWIEQTAGLKLAAMMHVHDLEASDLDKEDRHEVLSLLPSYEGKFVLELGAGIGRLTGDLAEKAWELVAVDFIERVIKENESINGHHKNVKFMCADVTSPDLTFSPESVDLIFSNWLLMYLSDEEVQDLAERMMTWLKVGGYIFFRETCFHQSGDNKGKNNPTHYREPRFYTKVFQECNAGKSYELSLVGYKSMETYVRNKRNQNEICWIWQKVPSEE